MKDRPIKFRRLEDITPENCEKIFQHFQEVINDLQRQVAELQTDSTDHENRILSLESA